MKESHIEALAVELITLALHQPAHDDTAERVLSLCFEDLGLHAGGEHDDAVQVIGALAAMSASLLRARAAEGGRDVDSQLQAYALERYVSEG